MREKANYVAGALVANSLVWVASAFLPQNLGEWWVSTVTFYLILSVLGGALGGYLVARRTLKFTPLRLGVVAGALSYAILAVVNTILGVESIVDSVTLIGFTAGFAIGARVIELRRLARK